MPHTIFSYRRLSLMEGYIPGHLFVVILWEKAAEFFYPEVRVIMMVLVRQVAAMVIMVLVMMFVWYFRVYTAN
jgi:hypothetical protein